MPLLARQRPRRLRRRPARLSRRRPRARLERDLAADAAALWPGETLATVNGIWLWAGSTPAHEIRFDGLRFSNSVTVEHNVLSPGGALGHIVRNRTIDPATFAATDAFLHYDQVGSVIAVSDSAGAMASQRHADAWGNDVQSWSTGLWASPAGGWGHNTKELDPAAGMVYMYQRWYDPQLGTFASSAPYPPMMEHRYGFADGEPTRLVDPVGEYPGETLNPAEKIVASKLTLKNSLTASSCNDAGIKAGRLAKNQYNASGMKNRAKAADNAIRHCVWMCCLSRNLSSQHWGAFSYWNNVAPNELAMIIGDAHEYGQMTKHRTDSMADQLNNRVGRSIGCDDCNSECRSKWAGNQLWRPSDVMGPVRDKGPR